MIGGRSGRCAPGTAGMTIGALPAARRLQQQQQQQQQVQQQPFYQNCWNGGRRSSVSVPASPGADGAASSTSAGQQHRKRPGCLCDCSHNSSHCSGRSSIESPAQPLDLSLPKIKVRQHWSGGSIVQVNDSTIISIGTSEDNHHHHHHRLLSSGRTLDVSVVAVPSRATSSGWSSSPAQVRLQIDIPLDTAATTQRAVNNNNNNSSSGKATSSIILPKMADDDDDLKRLADSAQQLRQCGFYYAHLSWKESVQLLQNTKIGTFLVRDSSDARYLYALSIQTDKGPTSVRVHYSSRGFRLDASQSQLADNLPRFRTVLNLVDHYVAKGAQCRDKGQFWLDNSGQVHSEVQLTRPLRKEVGTLQHLCRLAWNNRQRRHAATSCANKRLLDEVPHSIRSFLDEYPFVH